MRLYGLTGGTGSGKTAAASRFADRGMPVIDADKVGHEVLAPGGAAVEAVIAAFGKSILSRGIIDREKLAGQVFQDRGALKQLNAIVHPAIFAEIGQRCTRLSEDGHDAVLLDAALLGENGVREPWLAGLVLILAGEELRAQRLVNQRGMNAEDVARRIAAQTNPADKVAIADWVIENNGTLESLHQQVDQIVETIYGQTARQ